MELGCSTLLFGGYPLETALDGIARAGYKAIELCSIPGMAEHLLVDQPPQYYQDILKMCEDGGLYVESIGASTNLLDPERRERFVKLMNIGGEYGIQKITTGSGGKPNNEESWKQVRETVLELNEVTRDTGCRLSIKPHVGAAVYNTATAVKFIEDTDPYWVGLNFDASHIFRAGETPEEAIETLKIYIATSRIRDCADPTDPRPGAVETQICGKGKMNLPAIVKGLNTVPQMEYTVLEIVGTKDLPLEEVQRVITESKAYLDSLTG